MVDEHRRASCQTMASQLLHRPEVLKFAGVFKMHYQPNLHHVGNLTEVLHKLACAEHEDANKKSRLLQELARCIAKIATIGEAVSPRQASLLFLYQAHAQIIMERLALLPTGRKGPVNASEVTPLKLSANPVDIN